MGYNKSVMKKKILLIAMCICVLDQVTKIVANSVLKLGKSIKVFDQFFYFTKAYNDGVSFSMLSGHRWLVILISIAIMIFLYMYSKKFKETASNIVAFGLVLGGLVGNLIDRVVYGYVIDFIDFIIFRYDYPIFNVADSCICIGIFLLMYAIFKGEDNEISSK